MTSPEGSVSFVRPYPQPFVTHMPLGPRLEVGPSANLLFADELSNECRFLNSSVFGAFLEDCLLLRGKSDG